MLLRQAIAAATGKDASVQAGGQAKESAAGAAAAKTASGQTQASQASQDATAKGLKAATGEPAASTHHSAPQTKGPRSPQAKTAPAVTSEAGSPKANEQKQSAQAGSQIRTPGTAPEPKAAAAATHIAAHALEGARLSQEGKASRDAQRTKGRATGSAKAVAADGRPEGASAQAGRGGSAAQAKASHAAGSESARGFSVDRPQGGEAGQGQGSGPQGSGFSPVPAAQAQDGKAAGLASAGPDQAQRGTPGQALSDQIAETVRASGARDGQQVVVSLRPPELGRVRILFRRDGDSVRGSVQVESAATLAKLQREALPLMERLQEAGVQVRRLDMTLQPPPQGDTAANPQSREGQARPDGWAADGGGAASQGDGAEPSAGASAATASDGVVTDTAINVRI